MVWWCREMCDSSGSALLCQEDLACLDSKCGRNAIALRAAVPAIGTEMEIAPLLDEEDEDNYILALVGREVSFENEDVGLFPNDAVVVDGVIGREWFQSARSKGIRWILKARDSFGFSFLTAYLSICYIDLFFRKRSIQSRQSWVIQLLSVACLSIAVKMEEYQVPLLCEFQGEDYSFDSEAIQKMELLVLATLGWRMRLVTPFPYLRYLASKLEFKFQQNDLLLKATELVFSVIKTMSLINYRPSAIATATFFVASGLVLTRELLEFEISNMPLCGHLEIDQVLSCYNLIQETKTKLKPRKITASKVVPQLEDPCFSSSIDNIDDNRSSSSNSNKRRKLALNDYSCHCLT